MLELAYLNQLALKEIFAQKIGKEENKYYLLESFLYYDLTVDSNELHETQYVSKDSKGQIIGYGCAWINRSFNIIEKLEIINFSKEPNITASKDFIKLIEILLIKKGFRKIVFYAIQDNPALDMYKRWFIGHKIGKHVGTFKNHCILSDGRIYDMVIFELYRENFIKWMNKGKI